MIHDVIVIGAGPAGLTAASYLGRFLHPCLVLDGGESRAQWIPKSHNTPGFPAGVGGEELLARLRAQATRYKAQIISAEVLKITRTDQGFSILSSTGMYESRYVLLATGVRDELPPHPGAEAAVRRGLLRICPICDAFESAGKKIAVLGTGNHAFREAQFLQPYSDQITFINLGEHTEALRSHSEATGIKYRRARIEDLTIDESSVSVRDHDRKIHTFEIVYSALGSQPRNQLAAALGAECDENGALKVNAHQQTSLRGLYAAGDVVRGLNQIAIATAEAALAATDIHNRLRADRTAISGAEEGRPPDQFKA